MTDPVQHPASPEPFGVEEQVGIIPPTQTAHPWRATARTVFAGVVGGLSLVPLVAVEAGVDEVQGVVQVVAVAGAVTRVLAMPQVNEFLARFLPWLAAAPTK